VSWQDYRYALEVLLVLIVVCCVLLSSCIPNPDYLHRWQHDQVWDLGHGRTGTLSQPCTDVLSRSTSCHYRLWHHESGTSFDSWRVNYFVSWSAVMMQLTSWVRFSWRVNYCLSWSALMMQLTSRVRYQLWQLTCKLLSFIISFNYAADITSQVPALTADV